MLIAIVVVLAGIVAVAVGRGGELSHEDVDHAPLDMGPVSATDIVMLRPPTVLWGYSPQVTDEALERIAGAVRERDVRIVALEQRIVELTDGDDYGQRSPAGYARSSQPLPGGGLYAATSPPAGHEPGHEPGTGTGEAIAPQPAAGDQPAYGEITSDQAVNESDG